MYEPGFGYDFHSLNPTDKPNELAQAFQDVFNVSEKIPVLMILRNFFPILRLIVSSFLSYACCCFRADDNLFGI